MRYLGNKQRMLEKISEFMEENKIGGRIFCDLFSGSASVCDYFKDKFEIVANDLLYSSYVITRAKVKNAKVPKFGKFRAVAGTEFFEYFNQREYPFIEEHFIWKNYSPARGRQYFTDAAVNKIDGIPREIEILKKTKILGEEEYYFALASLLESAMSVSNITGTYEAFLKTWDKRTEKKFDYKPLEMEHKPLFCENNRVFREDADELIKQLSGDILYLDTPYTITDYSSAYHLLETIVRYDEPEINGLTGRRADKPEKSAYTRKSAVKEAYENLIKNANFKHIVVSYSTQGLLSAEELMEIFEKYAEGGALTVKMFPFREYKNIKSSKKGDGNGLSELLIYFRKKTEEKDAVLKSPLNYSGSKNYIVDQILSNLPQKFSVFVDAMGGAFNVGVNVFAEKVVYNEYNDYVFGIVKMLLETDKEELCKKISRIVKENGLERGNKETYAAFRAKYNRNQNPLDLFVLQMYCFQNQMRFNSRREFNTPVGNCACNETIFERIVSFVPKAKNIELLNMDFNDFDLSRFPKDTVFYFDPPYILTNATYNDGKRGFNGWDEEQDDKLLRFLEKIDANGQKFMLSNLLYHNKKTNGRLIEWCDKNRFRIIELIPHAGRYGKRREILVVNYEK